MSERTPSEISVAVLPFRNLSAQEEADYLVMGFVEDLITDLSRFGWTVLSRHFSTVHNSASASDRSAPDHLEADYLVRGSFRFVGDKVRISVQLVKADSGSVIFAGNHDEAYDALLQLQDEVTQQIVSVLQQQINSHLIAVSHKKPPARLAAYDYWLRGMNELKAGSLENDLKARKLFRQSLAVDPNYARAFTGLSLSYFNEWSCRLWSRWEISKTGAREFAQKAVALDDQEYLALAVLGRTYLFDGEYEKAENFLRRSLRLNPNDADNLVMVASCFVYLGNAPEALQWYERALRLNPFRPNWYYAYGSFIYFELGEYEKAVMAGKLVPEEEMWVDFPAYLAAAWYMLNDLERAEASWKRYVEVFRQRISKKSDTGEAEALEWTINVNPYKGRTNLTSFREYLKSSKHLQYRTMPPPFEDKGPVNTFLKEQDLWRIRYRSHSVLLRPVKGFYDLGKLLQAPGQSFHCTELMGALIANEAGVEHIDHKAKKAYQEKIVALQEELREAESMNDLERASRLNNEYETLLDHLSRSLGLGGKSRKKGATVEKARSAVTWRIRSAISRISEHHPALGKHLQQSIKTGILCRYSPETTVEWVIGSE